MRYGGGGWKPDNRRNRRQARSPRKSEPGGADRTFVVALVLFSVVALALAVVVGVIVS